jgi:hypothetical protein
MNRREFLLAATYTAFNLGGASAFAQSSGSLGYRSIENWGLIAFVTGALPDQATGIPVLAHYVRLNLIVRLGWGITLEPSPYPNEPWRNIIDCPLRIDEFTSESVEPRLARHRRELGQPDFLALIGHSKGAEACLEIANTGRIKEAVDLLVMIDPYEIPGARTTRLEPGVARRAVNYYTDTGPAGVHGYRIENVENHFMGNRRCSRKGCNQGRNHRYNHINLDDCDEIKIKVFSLIQQCFP